MELTTTVTDLDTEPPGPSQLNVKVVVAVNAPVVKVSAAFLLPVQPFEAVQDVMLVPLQVRTVVPPELTLVGLAVKVSSVGAGAVCTIIE